MIENHIKLRGYVWIIDNFSILTFTGQEIVDVASLHYIFLHLSLVLLHPVGQSQEYITLSLGESKESNMPVFKLESLIMTRYTSFRRFQHSEIPLQAISSIAGKQKQAKINQGWNHIMYTIWWHKASVIVNPL